MALDLTPDTEAFKPVAEEMPEVETVTLALQPRFMAWLRRRAQMYGDPLDGHVERILREFKAYHDESGANNQRHQPVEKGEMATTYRKA